MRNQPKPTGEWTVEGKAIWNHCEAVGVAESGKEAKIIADAHNAALTYEREKADAEMLRVKACEHIAEGDEGWEKLVNICPSTMAVAALRDQLTDEREKVQTIVNALTDTKSALNSGGYFTPIIDAALAKVKGK